MPPPGLVLFRCLTVCKLRMWLSLTTYGWPFVGVTRYSISRPVQTDRTFRVVLSGPINLSPTLTSSTGKIRPSNISTGVPRPRHLPPPVSRRITTTRAPAPHAALTRPSSSSWYRRRAMVIYSAIIMDLTASRLAENPLAISSHARPHFMGSASSWSIRSTASDLSVHTEPPRICIPEITCEIVHPRPNL